jgi:hypothetical protein
MTYGNERSYRLAGLILWAGVLLSASGAVAEPSATLVDPVARLDYGSVGGTPTMILQIDGLDAAAMQDPKLLANVHDLQQGAGSSTDPKVTAVDASELGPPGKTARTWLLSLQVSNVPANTSQKRYLSLDVAGKTLRREYTLTNRAIANFSWTVKAASMAISPRQSIPVAISVGPVPATDVKLINPYLLEKNSKAPIAAGGLQLCRESVPPCSPGPINLVASSATQLWLQGADDVGQYEGSITVAANEKPEGETVNLTVYSTTATHQFWGVVTIFGGALLHRRIGALQTKLKANPTGIATARLDEKLTDLLAEFAEPQLIAQGLPWPIPIGATPPAERLAAFRQYVQQRADWVAVLESIVDEGLRRIWPRWNDHPTGPQQQAIVDAMTALEGMANNGPAPALDAARADVRKQVAAVEAAFAAGPRRLSAALASAAMSPKTFDQLNMQIMRISLISWLFVILATTLVGALALVFTNTFGSGKDFLTCFVWGLGLPLGGQAVSASIGTVATTLGVSVAR